MAQSNYFKASVGDYLGSPEPATGTSQQRPKSNGGYFRASVGDYISSEPVTTATSVPADRGWGTLAADLGVKFGSGAINTLGALASLGSLAPGTNRMADPIGQGFGQLAEDFSESYLSDYQKNLDQQFNQAIANSVAQLGEDASISDHLENIKNQGGAAGQFILDNPAQALALTAESLPYLIGGGAVGRGLGVVTKWKPVTRAVAGETAVATGASTQQIVGDLQDQGITEWTPERLYGAAAGIGTGAISRLGARIQGPLDVDVLVSGGAGTLGKAPNAFIGATKGAVFEGAEELLQGAQEEAFGNLATGRPISENVGSSAIAGSIAGAGLGAGGGTLAGLARSSATQNQSPFVGPMPFNPGPQQPPVQGPPPPTQGPEQPIAGPGAPAGAGGNGFDSPGAVVGSVSPFLQPELQGPPTPIVGPQQPPIQGPAAPPPFVGPIPANNVPQNVPGSPVTSDIPDPIPTPTPAPEPETGTTGEKRPVLLKPRATPKPKVKRKPTIRTEPKEPEKKKPVKKKPTTKKKLPPQKDAPIPTFKPSKPKKGETDIEKEVRELGDLIAQAKADKGNPNGATADFYFQKVKEKKAKIKRMEAEEAKDVTRYETPEKSKPKRKKGTGKSRWKKTGHVARVRGTDMEYRRPVDGTLYTRKDGKPSPEVTIVTQGPKGGAVKFTPRENEALDAVLNAIHSWENLGQSIAIEIYKKHGYKPAASSGRGGLNPGAMWRSPASGKSQKMVIILDDLIAWSEKYDGGDIEFTAEGTVAHEIGVHGIQRMTGDPEGTELVKQNQKFWEKVYEENEEAIYEFIHEGEGGAYILKPKRTQAEEYFAFKLQEELADIAAGRRETYSARVKRYLRQVQAYLDSLYGLKFTEDQVAEMLVEAAERGMRGDKPLNVTQLWSNAKDGVFHYDDTVEWKSREPENPSAIESFARIDVGSVKPGWPTTERELKYYASRWNGKFLKGVKDWGWKGTTLAMIEKGELDPAELKDRFGKNVHSTFSYLNQRLSGVQGMDIEVVYEMPDYIAGQHPEGLGRASVYAKVRRKSDPSVYFNIRVSDHVPDMGEKVRIDAPITIDFANGPFAEFDQTWKDRIDLGLEMLRDERYTMSPIQAAIEYNINDGFMVKPLSEVYTTDKGYAKNAKSKELKELTKGKGQLIMERPGVDKPLDIESHVTESRYQLGEFTYKEFLDGYAVPSDTLQNVYFGNVTNGVRKSVKLPDPVDTVVVDNQEFTSADTSIKQVASMLKNPELFEEGSRNLDLGGGKYDLGTEAMAEHGVESRVMDEFNRDGAHNESVQEWVDKNPVDTVTVANVLNVIKEPEARDGVIKQAYDALKEGGNAYFQVYYDSKKEAGETKAGWQNHKPLKDYLPEVQKHFPDAYIKTAGSTRIIVAPKTGAVAKESTTEADIKALGIPVRDTKRGVGKRMGNDYYVHKSQEAAAIEEFGEARYRNAKKKIPAGFDYDLIHVNAKNGTIEFISSPDWNTANEPVRGEAIKISKEGVTKVAPKKREQIYHHKWSFVGPDYTGFNVQESMNRSASIGKALPKLKKKDPKITNRYGYKDVWESEVESELVADQQTDTPQSERKVSTKEYAKDWGTPKRWGDKTFWKNLVTGKGDVIPAHSREKAKQQLFAWNDYLIAKTNGKVDLTSLSITGLGGLKDVDTYLQGRYKMMGGFKEVEKLASDIYKTFNKYGKSNPEYNTAIFDYLTGKFADPAMSPKEQREASERVLRSMIKDAEVVALAIKLKKRINSNAKQAVELGLLKSDHPTDGDQNYLPRLYLKHIMETEDYKILAGGGGRISNRGYAKKRKELEEATRAYLGEVKDAAFLGASTISQVGRDISIAGFLQDISSKEWGEDNNWVLPGSVVNISMFRGGVNDESSAEWTQRIDVREVGAGVGKPVSVQWLLDEAGRIRERSAQTKDKDAKAMAEDLANQLEALYEKKNGEMMSSEEYQKHKNQYRQVPISSRYGALSGMYVNKRIYNDLFNNGPAFDNKYWRAAEQYHAWWKILKVPLNPPTIARNVMSNSVLQTLAGIPLHKVAQYNYKALMSLWDYHKRGGPKTEAMKVGDKYGLGTETFASREMIAILDDFQNKAKTDPSLKESQWAMAMHMAKAGAKAATNFYGEIEVWQKLAVIQYHLDQGADPWTAFKEAQDTLFDYSLLNAGAKKFRRSPIGAPFLSFSMLATRRLGQVIATNPMRLMWWVAASQVLWYLTAGLEDVDREDLRNLHKALPKYLAEKWSIFLLPVPGRDGEGRMRFYDFSYTHPFGGLFEMAKNTSKGEVDKVMEMMGLGGAPLLQMMMALYTNEDPFTKKDITNEEFTVKEKMWDYTRFLWRHTMPSLVTGQGAFYKMWQASEFDVPLLGWEKKKAVGSSLLDWGETKTTLPQAMLRLGGINLYSVDPGKTAQKNLMILQYRKRDLDAGYNRKLREAVANKDEKAKERITATWKAQVAQLAQEMEEMKKLRKVHPNLKIKDIKK